MAAEKSNGTFEVHLRRREDFLFDVQFDWESAGKVTLDEPEPLGKKAGPNASRLLGAAVGNCLSASLLFCLQKMRQPVQDLHTRVTGHLTRNQNGRLRIGSFEVEITLDLGEGDTGRIQRCLNIFQDYCTVSASIKPAIPIRVRVSDREGTLLYDSERTA